MFISPVRIDVSSSLSILENRITVLNDKLYRKVLGMHIRHLAFKTCVTHDSGCENDSQVLGGHLNGHISFR